MGRLTLMLPFLAACGADAGPGQFTGTVQGHGLEVRSALLVGGTEIWLGSTPQLCPRLVAHQLPKGGTLVKLTLRPLAVGAFTVDPSTSTQKPNTAALQFLKLNETCANTLEFGRSVGTRGAATVSAYQSGQTIEGTFEATFGDSDLTRGSFRATACNAPTLYPMPECVAAE